MDESGSSIETRHLPAFEAALKQPAVEVSSEKLAIDAPKSLSVVIREKPLAVKSFLFEAPPAPLATADGMDRGSPQKTKPKALRKKTRIQPPNDIVKLVDRIFYLLQPPLESLVSSGALNFPFEPFGYQMEGIAFLYARHAAILADEMGLGKTMQAVSTTRLLLHAGEIRNVLLICPKPLVTNWLREFGLWAPEVSILAIEGDQVRRRWCWTQADVAVRVANYELILRDRDLILEAGHRFDLVVLDEAQRIKNRSSSTSEAVCEIARHRSWALTGTPVENSAEDLIGIFEFLAPGYLHSGMKLGQLGKSAGEYTLRRTKDMVLDDLPPKLFRDAEVTLTPSQQATYETAEGDGIVQLSEMGEALTIQHVFELVLRLKQICNFDPVTGDSSKLERLEADLEEVAASGKKAIVFSQWVKTLDRMQERLGRFHPLAYHGKIPSRHRDEVLRKFREEEQHRVILMSYGAGSVGLNLQFCGYVFLFDRWWNPAVEDQAINRAHRIGATGPVTVSRYLTMGTIEERIDQVLQEKRELFDAILSAGNDPQPVGMTQDEIFGLFNLRSPRGRLGKAA